MSEVNEVMQPYLNYFGCLLLGIFIVKKYFPEDSEEKDSFFHKFLISSTTTFAGALLGSSFYNLTYPRSASEASESDDSEDEE